MSFISPASGYPTQFNSYSAPSQAVGVSASVALPPDSTGVGSAPASAGYPEYATSGPLDGPLEKRLLGLNQNQGVILLSGLTSAGVIAASLLYATLRKGGWARRADDAPPPDIRLSRAQREAQVEERLKHLGENVVKRDDENKPPGKNAAASALPAGGARPTTSERSELLSRFERPVESAKPEDPAGMHRVASAPPAIHEQLTASTSPAGSRSGEAAASSFIAPLPKNMMKAASSPRMNANGVAHADRDKSPSPPDTPSRSRSLSQVGAEHAPSASSAPLDEHRPVTLPPR